MFSQNTVPRFVVTEGDFGGIGPEALLHALDSYQGRIPFLPLILGHKSLLEELAIREKLQFNFFEVSSVEGWAASPLLDQPRSLGVLKLDQEFSPPIVRGVPCKGFGTAAVEAVQRAVQLCLSNNVDGMITSPVNKESMHLAGFNYEGQTEIIGEASGASSFGMLACAEKLRVWVATRHMSLKKAIALLTPEFVFAQIKMAHVAATETLGLENPRIALSGLNPHASENGAFGREEANILLPALKLAEKEGIQIEGPIVPDVVFSRGARGAYDVVIALYHDQAFIPLKMLAREQAYSLFVGADLLRVSPMHGTAYDIVEKYKIDARPMRYCFDQAVHLFSQRRLLKSS